MARKMKVSSVSTIKITSLLFLKILILDYGCYTGVPLPNSHFPELRAENRDENSAFFFKTVY